MCIAVCDRNVMFVCVLCKNFILLNVYAIKCLHEITSVYFIQNTIAQGYEFGQSLMG